MEEVPATSPESGAPEMRHVEPGRLEQEQMAAVGGYSPPPETWRMFMSQLGQLLQSAAQLIATMSELGVVLTIAEEADISSLRVAQGIQAHFALRQSPSVAACVGFPGPAGAGTPQREDGLAAFVVGNQCGRGAGGRRPAGEDSSLAGVDIHRLFLLWPAGPYCVGLPQHSRGLQQDFVYLCLHIGGVIQASGESRRIDHSAAPFTSHI
ncbi:unnamed protein product [Lampetra fluviatilis]